MIGAPRFCSLLSQIEGERCNFIVYFTPATTYKTIKDGHLIYLHVFYCEGIGEVLRLPRFYCEEQSLEASSFTVPIFIHSKHPYNLTHKVQGAL